MKSNTEKFISNANIIHNFKYDYSIVSYINAHSKVKIKCPLHGIFFQSPNAHLSGHGCAKCAKCEKITTEEFINRAKKIHGNKYDYSKTCYKEAHKKLIIKCPEHGRFLQTGSSHINTKCGCPKCAGKDRAKKNKKLSETFIKEAIKIHKNKYDYSKINYVNAHKKIKIICKTHGEFMQSPNNHIKGSGCSKCRADLLSKKFTLTTDIFITKAKLVHKNKYDYSLVEYKHARKKVIIICLKHDKFFQSPNSHLNGTGCPKCKISKGELKIMEWLIKNDVPFKPQKSFKDLKSPKKRSLFFDFYLIKNNSLIEFDGEQHVRSNNRFSEEVVKKIKIYDEIKNEYCRHKNIPLLRIPYNKLHKIDGILESFVK